MLIAAAEARRLRDVHELDAAVRAEVSTQAGGTDREKTVGSGMDARDVEALVEAEVGIALGISRFLAGRCITLARRLHEVLPATLSALESGRVDLARVRALDELTAHLPPTSARRVEDVVLPGAGDAVWDGPSLQLWRRRVHRAAARVESMLDEGAAAAAATAVREGLAAQTRTWVDIDPHRPGLATLNVVGPTEMIIALERSLTDLAQARPDQDAAGAEISIGRRRLGMLVDLVDEAVLARLAGAAVAGSAPGLRMGSTRTRERELGLVLHADTLFADGAAADDPGELRGLGLPVPIGAPAAREMARTHPSRTATCVLLTASDGRLERLVRLRTPDTGWTRSSLTAAVRVEVAADARTGDPPDSEGPLSTDGYRPSAAIADHVRAAYPTCTAPGCHRSSSGCDLDHDVPWPRGATSTANLNPKSRRCHTFKTRRIWRSTVHPDGAVSWVTLAGSLAARLPDPLPGYGPGEGYDGRRGTRRTVAAGPPAA